jgi:hypothetical protein
MSECDLPEFYDYSEPVARKKHVCCECSAPIDNGEKHFHCVGKWNGDFQTYRQHLLCMEACMLIRDKFNDHECIAFGELQEFFEELTRDQYDRERQRNNESWKRLRSLIARILWRELCNRFPRGSVNHPL